MNPVVFNWLATVRRVVDPQTVDVLLDRGFREVSDRRMGIHYREKARFEGMDPDDRRKALVCLQGLLEGRTVVASTLRPNRRGRAYARFYVRAEAILEGREDLVHTHGDLTFLSIDKAMCWLQDRGFSEDQAFGLVRDLELVDYLATEVRG